MGDMDKSVLLWALVSFIAPIKLCFSLRVLDSSLNDRMQEDSSRWQVPVTMERVSLTVDGQ